MTKWVRTLLIANVVVYFLQLSLGIGFTNAFLLYPPAALTHPWTIVTYMFLHDPNGFSHIVFNMLGLYIFGPNVESRLGSNRFITLYMIGGITGALFSFIWARQSPILGASAAIYAVMMAYAYFWPRDRILLYFVIPVEIRFLVIGYTALALFGGSGIGGLGGNTAHFAHLGGFAGGFVYVWWLGQTTGSRRFRKVATKVAQPAVLSNWKRVDPSKVHEVNRDELNRILDKIGKSGLASLTPDESRFLMSFVPPDDRPPLVS